MNELIKKWAQEDRDTFLKAIPFFHGYYARTKDSNALEIARNLGIAADKLK